MFLKTVLRVLLSSSVLNLFILPSCLSIALPSTNFVTHESQCNNSNICDPNSLLMCIAGTCQCESPSNQVFENSTGICLSVVGGQCTLDSDYSRPNNRRQCIINAQCVLKSSVSYNYTECQCREGFIENSDGSCVPGIGKPCNYEPHECNPLGMVVCKNGKCSCLDELQIYDNQMKRCVSPAGTHCKYDSVQLGCVRNAICYPFYYWIPPRCICKPGYIQSMNRTCILEAEAILLRSRDLEFD